MTMNPYLLLLVNFLILTLTSSLRQVAVINQTEPVLIMEGRTVRLSCSIHQPWFFCLWDTPGNSKDMECAIQYFQPERICSKSNKTKLIAHKDSCDVQFVVIFLLQSEKKQLTEEFCSLTTPLLGEYQAFYLLSWDTDMGVVFPGFY